MKVGDLVKRPDAVGHQLVRKVFLVTESRKNWIKLVGYIHGWHRMADWEVISESR